MLAGRCHAESVAARKKAIVAAFLVSPRRPVAEDVGEG